MAELLNDVRRSVMRVLVVLKDSETSWSLDDMRCVSAVHTGSSRDYSTGGGVASWVFSFHDIPKAYPSCWNATRRNWVLL